MQYKKLKLAIIYIIVGISMLFILTGCYDATSVESYYYAVAIGIDEIENSNNINLSVQIAQSSSSSGGGTSQSTNQIVYQVECLSIDSGISILNNYLNKEIDLLNCSAIIFSENLAKKGIISYVNTLQNNVEIRPNCNIIISSQKAYDVLEKVANTGENFSARFFEHIISSAKYTGYTLDADFNQFFTNMNSANESALAIYATVAENTVQNTGIAIFRKDYLVGHVDTEGVISHLILTNKLDSSIVTIPSPFKENDTIDLSIKPSKNTEIDVNLVNNNPYIECDIYLSANIVTINESSDYSSSDNIKKLENNLNRYIENIVSEYLYTTSKQYSCDTISFGEKLSKKYKTLDEFKKVNWDTIYKDSFFKVRTHCEVVSSSLITKQ